MTSRMSVLEGLVRKYDWKRGAELGVYQGQTFFHLLDACPALSMVGVDRWERTPGPVQDRETGFASYEKKPMNEFAADVKKRAERYGSRAVIHHAETAPTASIYLDGTFDFIFIDASHDTASVRADVQAWMPKVKRGGWILGHDINWPSVRRAVEAEFGKVWAEMPAHVWSARKPI